METIYKYPIQLLDEQEILLPEKSVVLSVQVQDTSPCIWVKLDPSDKVIPRKFYLRGTGHPLEFPKGEYIFCGTFQLFGGSLVYHLFETH